MDSTTQKVVKYYSVVGRIQKGLRIYIRVSKLQLYYNKNIYYKLYIYNKFLL